MGGSIEDEDEKKLLLDYHHQKSRKGGHITTSIILVNDACERVASVGLFPNMVLYLMNEYHLEAAPASIILSVWSALSSGLAIVGGFLADSYLGRFRVIALGSISSLCGTILIWLTAMIPQLRPLSCDHQLSNGCSPPTVAQLLVLFCSFALISTGTACIRPCSMAFGIDQVDEKRNPNCQRAVERYINWYNSFMALGSVFTMTVVIYIQDNTSWKVGFAVCAVCMAFSAPVFLLASSLYVKVKVGKSLLTGCFQVIVSALKNKSVTLPPTNHTSKACYYQGDQTAVLAPTDNLRCLNKACIVRNPERDIKPDGSCSDPWSLCTVEQVEALKNVLLVFPIWSTSIIFQAASAPASFQVLQAKTMYRHITPSFEIPAATVGVAGLVSFLLCSCVYEGLMIPLLVRFTGQNRGLSSKTRMAIGLMFTGFTMAMSAVVETTRRNVAIKQGSDDVEAGLDISVMWLVPQFVLIGMSNFFYGNGLTEYLYTQLSKKMGSIAMALFILSASAGNLFSSLLVDMVDSMTGGGGGKISWLASNINKGHLDYYYWLLGLLNLINFVYFYVCWWWFGTTSDGVTSGTPSYDRDEQEESS